jgi:hypothetical protein
VLPSTEPSALTGSAKTNCPDESTINLSLFTLKAPFLVKTVWLEVADGFSAKKPCPEIAKSRAFNEEAIFPCVNCGFIPFNILPEPIEDDEFCNGEVANI